MIVVRDPVELADAVHGSCVTVGNFDGVHLGHKALIDRVRQKALPGKLTSVVVTFDPHPVRVLTGRSEPPFITLTDQKLSLIGDLGIDVCVLVEFTRDVAALDAEAFTRRYLLQGLAMKELIMGYDAAIGRKRMGTFELMSAIGSQYGFGVERFGPVIIDGAVVSSTRIRDLVLSGKVWEARSLLGRYYILKGEVGHGKKRGGSLLGFPTANILPTDELAPKNGVYAVWAEVSGEILPAVANIGFNPTFGNDTLSIEVHILDIREDLYGREIKVHFVQRLRDEKKFSGIDELKERIAKDIELAKQIFAGPNVLP